MDWNKWLENSTSIEYRGEIYVQPNELIRGNYLRKPIRICYKGDFTTIEIYMADSKVEDDFDNGELTNRFAHFVYRIKGEDTKSPTTNSFQINHYEIAQKAVIEELDRVMEMVIIDSVELDDIILDAETWKRPFISEEQEKIYVHSKREGKLKKILNV